MPYFVGIDVGTGSVRAGLFDATGALAPGGFATQTIRTWNPQTDFYEQSSDDIWRASGAAVRACLNGAKISPNDIKGIGFDATCSLVLLDEYDKPVTVSPTGSDEQNVILWMDHRALAQAERINETKHHVLRYVGGVISPEMQCPKLLWLKEHAPTSWRRARRFLDLPDFLTFKATSSDVRSLCTVVCKWTYQSHGPGWDESFFHQIGLGDLAVENWIRIGSNVGPMGTRIASGLTAQAAADLGLLPGTAVGIGIIDAHAGGIGTLGASLTDSNSNSLEPSALQERLALIAGTSACHMACSQEPIFIDGIWGPYKDAMIPGMWLTEGGQSAVGALLDHIVHSHPRHVQLQDEAVKTGKNKYNILNSLLTSMAASNGATHVALLTKDLHVLPYFHGNRSPRADPTLRGIVAGLNMNDDIESLALLYLATLQAICLGTRHIIAEMNARGYNIKNIFTTGGLIHNSLFLEQLAVVTNCNILIPTQPEAVVLGSAVLGAVASGQFASVVEAMSAMNHVGKTIRASEIGADANVEVAAFYERKYQVFLAMYEDQMKYRRLMSSSS